MLAPLSEQHCRIRGLFNVWLGLLLYPENAGVIYGPPRIARQSFRD